MESFTHLRKDYLQKHVELEDIVNKSKFGLVELKIKVEPLDYDFFSSETFFVDDNQAAIKIETKPDISDDDNDEEVEEVEVKPPIVLSIFKCRYCPRSFGTEILVENHHIRLHKDLMPANEVTVIRKRIKDDRKLVCALCGVQTHYIKDHMRKRHLKSRRFFCDKCKYCCYKKYDMRNHMKKHLKSEIVPLHCDLCTSTFSWKSGLQIHMRNKHGSKESTGPVVCKCGKVCASKGSLFMHMRSKHSEDSGVKVKCHLCNKEVVKLHMNLHMRQVHARSTEVCDICGKTFKNKIALRSHKKLHNEKSFVCQYEGCDKAYEIKSKLDDHKKTHNEQRDFRCTYEGCDKSYFKNRCLRMHIGLTHEKYTVDCPVPACSFSVGRRDYMRTHILRHRDISKEEIASYLEKIKKIKLL